MIDKKFTSDSGFQAMKTLLRAKNPPKPLPGGLYRDWYLSLRGTTKTVQGELRAALKDCKTVRQLFNLIMTELSGIMSGKEVLVRDVRKLMVSLISTEIKKDCAGEDFETITEIALFKKRFKYHFPEIFPGKQEFLEKLDERMFVLASKEMAHPDVNYATLRLIKSFIPYNHEINKNLNKAMDNYSWGCVTEN